MESEAVARRGRVLVIDLGGERGAGLDEPLRAAGFAVCACSNVRAGLAAFVRVLPDLIVLAEGADGREAIDCVERIREISDVPLILVGVEDPDEVAVERALARGADRFLAGAGAGDGLAETASELLAQSLAAIHAPSVLPQSTPRMTAAHARRVAREALRRELEHQVWACQGNLAEVGRRMGRDRSTIRYHLRRFGMLADANGSPSEAPAARSERTESIWSTHARSDEDPMLRARRSRA